MLFIHFHTESITILIVNWILLLFHWAQTVPCWFFMTIYDLSRCFNPMHHWNILILTICSFFLSVFSAWLIFSKLHFLFLYIKLSVRVWILSFPQPSPIIYVLWCAGFVFNSWYFVNNFFLLWFFLYLSRTITLSFNFHHI